MMADRNVRRPIPAGLAYIADNINAGDNILGLHKANKSRWAEGIDFSQDRSTVFLQAAATNIRPCLSLWWLR